MGIETEVVTVTVSGPNNVDLGTITNTLSDAISRLTIEPTIISKNIQGTSTKCKIGDAHIQINFNIENDLQMPEVEE